MTINERLLFATFIFMLAVPPQPVMALTDQQQKMIDQLDQLDQKDHQEFNVQKDKAEACIRAHDFSCADKKIDKAAKFAGNSQDKKALRLLQQQLADERTIEKEERQAAVRKVEQEKREEAIRREQENLTRADRREKDERIDRSMEEYRATRKLKEEQERTARAQNRDSGPGLGMTFLAVATGAYVGNATRGYSPEQQSKLMESSMKSVMNNDAEEFKSTSDQVNAEHKQEHNARMREIREQKERDEQAAREQQDRDERAATNRRAQVDERNRQAQLNRQQSQTQTRKPQTVASVDQAADTAEQQDQRKRTQKSTSGKGNAGKKGAESGVAGRSKDEAADDQARQKERERKKAEAKADKQAELQTKKMSEKEFLQRVAAGTRLVATKCPDGEGKYYATGKKPSIKPDVVSCVDVHFRAYCPGSAQYVTGIAGTFVGLAGCFGDTYEISPKPNCKVDQVRIEVVEVRPCGG